MAGVVAEVVAVAAQCSIAGDAGRDAQRRAAAMAEKLKEGEVGESARVAVELISHSLPVEARLFGYLVLSHLIRHRWRHFSEDQRRELGNVALANLRSAKEQTGSDAWVSKSKSAALCCEVIIAEGPAAWNALHPEIMKLADQEPASVEMCCVCLRTLAEEVTVYNEGLAAERLRSLLGALTSSLQLILPTLYNIMESNIAKAEAASAARQPAEPYISAVRAALQAAIAYAEWVPVLTLQETKLVLATAFLIKAPALRLEASQFLAEVASRKRFQDEKDRFNAAIRDAANAVIALELPKLAFSHSTVQNDEDNDFYKNVADALSSFASYHFGKDGPFEQSEKDIILESMLHLSRHPDLNVAGTALQGWGTLLRVANTQQRDVIGPLGKYVNFLLALLSERMSHPASPEEYETQTGWIAPVESGAEFREVYGNFRARLQDIGKSLGKYAPSECFLGSLKHTWTTLHASLAATPSTAQIHAIEGAALLLESVATGVPNNFLSSSECLNGNVEAPVNFILGFKHPGPVPSIFLVHSAQCIEALSRLLQHYPQLLTSAVSRLMDIVVGMVVPGLTRKFPPLTPNGSLREILQHRQRITLLMRKVSTRKPEVLVPHLNSIAQRVEQLLTEDQIQNGEYAMMCEMLVKIAASEGIQRLQSMLSYISDTMGKRWSQPNQINILDSINSFVPFFCPPGPVEKSGATSIGGGSERWIFFCEIQVIESCFRAVPTPVVLSSDSPDTMAPAFGWMIPMLLGMMKCLHQAWTPAARAVLGTAAAATTPCVGEREVLLGKGTVGAVAAKAAAAGSIEDDSCGVSSSTIGSLRGFLRASRDAVYAVFGHIITRSYQFYGIEGIGPASASALFESLNFMESRHLRQILRLILCPLVRSCPPEARNNVLFVILNSSFKAMLHRATQQSIELASVAMDTESEGCVSDDEVVKARTLVELIRETCTLVQDILEVNQVAILQKKQSPIKFNNSQVPQGLNKGMFPHILMNFQDLGLAVVQFVIFALRSSDSEAVLRSIICARALAAISQHDTRLHRLVGGDMLISTLIALGSDANTALHADLLSVMKDILWHLSSTGIPWEVLRGMSGISADAITSLQSQLATSKSDKEQRNMLKSFVLAAGGDTLKALAPPKRDVAIKLTSKAVLGRSLEVASGGEEVVLPQLF